MEVAAARGEGAAGPSVRPALRLSKFGSWPRCAPSKRRSSPCSQAKGRQTPMTLAFLLTLLKTPLVWLNTQPYWKKTRLGWIYTRTYWINTWTTWLNARTGWLKTQA